MAGGCCPAPPAPEAQRAAVAEFYAAAAGSAGGCCGDGGGGGGGGGCGSGAGAGGGIVGTGPGCGGVAAPALSELLGYSAEELLSLPDGANLGLGCGNPVRAAGLKVRRALTPIARRSPSLPPRSPP